MINHIENYLDWLRKNMKEEVIKKGKQAIYIEISRGKE